MSVQIALEIRKFVERGKMELRGWRGKGEGEVREMGGGKREEEEGGG